MTTSYQFFKNGGAKEMSYNSLPKGYGWVTGCGGDGWYWNFFMKDDDMMGERLDPKKAIMCKIKPL